MLLGMKTLLHTLKKPIVHAWITVLLLLIGIYALTMQTIPNGSSHYYMIDVGETQLVLNLWGSLHATGYPLYVILGNILTTVMRAVGISPLIAPALTSLLWGILALTTLYILAYHYTRKVWLSAFVIGVFGLARTIWIHHIIAEVYTFGLLIVALLLLIALWKNPIRGRIFWLAFIGGIGVAHHRAIAMMIPALLYAVYPIFIQNWRKSPQLVGISLGLGLIGFVQYLYMYLRGVAGGAWVYGEPETLQGVWTEFMGVEAERFIGLQDSSQALVDNFMLVNEVLLTDITIIGVLVGIIGLGIGLIHYKKLAIVMILNGVAAYAFHVLMYSDVLSALIIPIVLSLAFGWLFLIELVLRQIKPAWLGWLGIAILFVGACAGLLEQHLKFMWDVTTDKRGLEIIAMLKQAPPDSVVMIAWGPDHFPAGIGRDLTGELTHITLVDHKADYAGILAEGKTLITPYFSRYTHPTGWWQERVGQIYPVAIAPHLVHIKTTPEIGTDIPQDITMHESFVTCKAPVLYPSGVFTLLNEFSYEKTYYVHVTWQAGMNAPTEDFRVFVHGSPMEGPRMAQGDQPAPVYTWRPTTTWQAGEIVHDIYPISILSPRASIHTIRFGMYRIAENGEFENVSEYSIRARCDEE